MASSPEPPSFRLPRARRGSVQAWALGEVLARGHRGRVTVEGRSMMPLVHPGASLDVEACSVDDVRPGDVLVVLRGRRLIVHRAIGRDAVGRWATRGDANAAPDPWVGDERLIGRVVGFPLGSRSLRLPPLLDVGARAFVLSHGPAMGRLYRGAARLHGSVAGRLRRLGFRVGA